MDDPLAYFFTWPTYGTWLPGDQRGWVLFKRGWQLPDSSRYLESQARRKHAACTLGPAARQIVELQVGETCRHRDWTLHAVNCRNNHMHVVVGSANTDPKKIRKDLKAWCTRRLKQSIDPTRDTWWAERGSIRWIFGEEDLQTVVQYVTEAQDRKASDLS